MADTKKIIVGLLIGSIFAFGFLSFFVDFADKAEVTLDENYTVLLTHFKNTTDQINILGEDMRTQLDLEGGFDITSAGFILLKGIYSVALLPLKIIPLVLTLITAIGNILGIPDIYVGAAVTLLSLIMIFALVSLLFRKEF